MNLENESHSQTRERQIQMSPGVKHGILVIGYDSNFCYLLQRFGRIGAYSLEIADPDEAFFPQVRRWQPAVIFLEAIQQGDFTQNLIHEIKTCPDTRHIHIVLCSWQDEEHMDDQTSPDDYLRLPILYDHFKNVLERIDEPL